MFQKYYTCLKFREFIDRNWPCQNIYSISVTSINEINKTIYENSAFPCHIPPVINAPNTQSSTCYSTYSSVLVRRSQRKDVKYYIHIRVSLREICYLSSVGLEKKNTEMERKILERGNLGRVFLDSGCINARLLRLYESFSFPLFEENFWF